MVLFARRGFHNTSIPDIVNETGLSTGTIYTYFRSKEDIMNSIISEGWESFSDQLTAIAETHADSEERIRMILETFLNLLEESTDLVNILISEALHSPNAGEMLEKVLTLLASVLRVPALSDTNRLNMSKPVFRTGVIIFLMGIIDTVRLAKAGTVSAGSDQIKEFIMVVMKNAGLFRTG